MVEQILNYAAYAAGFAIGLIIGLPVVGYLIVLLNIHRWMLSEDEDEDVS